MNNTTLLLIAYNRPDLLSKQILNIKSLKSKYEYDISIFVDGPKPGEDHSSYIEITQLVNDNSTFFDHTNILVENVGLKENIKRAILFSKEHYDKFILVEDDINFSDSSMLYVLSQLDNFDVDDTVYHINLWNHDFINFSQNKVKAIASANAKK